MYRTHGWDSFGQVTIAAALEEDYSVSISDEEIIRLNSMKAILDRFQSSGDSTTR